MIPSKPFIKAENTAETQPAAPASSLYRRSKALSLSPWNRHWLGLAMVAALVATFVDAVLIQRKYQIFTGGFLTTDYLEEPLDISLFLLASFFSDLGVIAVLVAAGLYLVTRMRLNAKPAILAIFVAALVPILVADFLAYQLEEYVGDMIGFTLTYEVSGRSSAEMLAVVAPHLVAPALLLVGIGAFLLVLVWIYKKALARWIPLPPAPPVAKLVFAVSVVFFGSLGVTALVQAVGVSFQQALQHKPSGRLYGTIVEGITDVDRDGYGFLHRQADPAPFDAEVFPYAMEIPGNGIDENGVGGDLPVEAADMPTSLPAVPTWSSRPNVIFILLESVRADLIEATYRGKPITPVLNDLGKKGVSATLAFSHNGFTAPSRYYSFTGSLLHGGDKASLIDDFKANGYEVAYFSAQDESFGGAVLDVGFARSDVAYDARVEPNRRYTAFTTPGSLAVPYQVILEKVAEYFKSRNTDRPLFLCINFQDTHFPYHHSGIQNLISDAALSRTDIRSERVDELWATYANTAANVDKAIGELLAMGEHYLNDLKPGIIITSDHGESLFEDGLLGHGIAMNDLQMQVPFIAANLPIRLEQPFGHMDLRRDLRQALSETPESDSPTVTTDPSRTVFLYLGDLKRPRQIAFRRAAGYVIYDFNIGLFQTSEGEWQSPENLPAAAHTDFLNLVHYWERVVVANR